MIATAWMLAICALLMSLTTPVSGQSVDFNRDIKPILVENCYACHGPHEEAREGNLALHDRDAVVSEELYSGGYGIVPGDPSDSEIWYRITSDDEFERMPPADSAPALSESQQALIRRWIEAGAKYDLHWSLRPIERPQPPPVADSDWVQNPIDHFVLQRLEAVPLRPAPRASREKLIRRLSLDLIGLPPTPAETMQFVEEDSPQAYEQLVDRLLASKKFGEHWARQWLDLARYADSQGYAQDEIRTIWPYRDWVIQAFNDDLPFDQFTIDQLAGDLLPNPTTAQLVATGFHRNTMTNTEGGTDDEEFRYAAVIDRANTTSSVWLGLTMACAQCHTHKFDPITIDDYYSFFAIFNQTADNDLPDNRPTMEYLTERQQQRIRRLTEQLQEIVAADTTEPGQLREAARKLGKVKKQLAEIRAYRTPMMQELPGEGKRVSYVAERGSRLSPGRQVQPRLPTALRDDSAAPVDRLELARWLVSDDHPLTPRVTVNRIWANLFGVGIVETVADFGSQGELPSHPQLLDWLAVEFRERGWSRKQLIKTIVMSATYQQSSAATPEKLEADPGNRLLSRGSRYRLSAEQLRDYALQCSGLLSDKLYGPPVRPPQPESGLKAAFGGSLDWEPSQGEDRYRRAIYTLWRRTNPYPSFMALDATDRKVCTARRINTNTPVGAFVTLNDPAFVEAAVALALKINRREGADRRRLEDAFHSVVCRTPTSQELTVLEQLLNDQREIYSTKESEASELLAVHPDLPSLAPQQVPEVAAWTLVVNTLFNLDEVLTRN